MLRISDKKLIKEAYTNNLLEKYHNLAKTTLKCTKLKILS
jgi:hypothetical protein